MKKMIIVTFAVVAIFSVVLTKSFESKADEYFNGAAEAAFNNEVDNEIYRLERANYDVHTVTYNYGKDGKTVAVINVTYDDGNTYNLSYNGNRYRAWEVNACD